MIEQQWPPYRVGNADHLHALGVIASVFNLLEFRFRSLPDLRLDGRLDSRSASKSLWCRGWVFQRPEFPASRGVDLGGGDVRLDNAAIRHSAFPARSTGSERE